MTFVINSNTGSSLGKSGGTSSPTRPASVPMTEAELDAETKEAMINLLSQPLEPGSLVDTEAGTVTLKLNESQVADVGAMMAFFPPFMVYYPDIQTMIAYFPPDLLAKHPPTAVPSPGGFYGGARRYF